MEICALCKKQLVMKSILAIIDLKTTEIAKALHTSQSQISRHLLGEIEKPEVDIYIIEQLLGIKIEGYKLTDERVQS
jgi:predicted XRE-type DNA-binding protein